MPVDIAKAYFEIQQLRREVQKAERAVRASFARAANRSRIPGRTNASGPQATNPHISVLKRSQH